MKRFLKGWGGFEVFCIGHYGDNLRLRFKVN